MRLPPPRSKKSSARPPHLGAQHVEPQLGQRGRRARQHLALSRCAARRWQRPRQGVAVDLPGGTGRQVADDGEPRHQRRRQVGAQALGGSRRVEGRVHGDVADQQLVARLARAHGGSRADHARHSQQRAVDLAELDPTAPQLHLVVGAAAEQQAGAVEADQVAAAVGALPAQARERRVLLGVLLRVEVAGQPDTADDQLARLPRRHGVAGGVDDSEVPAVQRQPDAHRPRRLETGGAGDDGRLGRAVGVPHLAAVGGQPCAELGRDRLASQDQHPDTVERLRRPERDERRDRRDDGDVVGHQPRPHVDPAADQRPRRGHQAGRVGPRQPHLLARGVEADRESSHDPVADADRLVGEEQPALGVHEGGRVAVGDGDALGGPGRAGGEDDPGVVLGLDRLPLALRAVGAAYDDGQPVADDGTDLRLVEDEAGPLVGVVGVDRHVAGARLEDPQDRDVQLERAGADPDPDPVAAADAGGRQRRRELARGVVQLGVGQHLDAVVDRRRFRRGLGALAEDVHERPRRSSPAAASERSVLRPRGGEGRRGRHAGEPTGGGELDASPAGPCQQRSPDVHHASVASGTLWLSARGRA